LITAKKKILNCNIAKFEVKLQPSLRPSIYSILSTKEEHCTMQNFSAKIKTLFLKGTKTVIDKSKPLIDQAKEVDFEKYVHPESLSNFGIERLAAFALDLFIFLGLSMFPAFGWVLAIAYMLLRESLPFLQGQSIGKRYFKLRAVTSTTGKPLTRRYKRSIIRGGVTLIPILNLIDAYHYFKHGERLADKWAHTVVIKEEISSF
jgi:uncharacterized RDD family membrane protein YckC